MNTNEKGEKIYKYKPNFLLVIESYKYKSACLLTISRGNFILALSCVFRINRGY